MESVFDSAVNDKMFQMGCLIGSFVNSFRKGLADSLGYPMIERECTKTSIKFFCDINTNKKNPIFSKGQNKEINLFYLHLLCNMNFVKYILRPLFKDENIWIFRVEYVVSYYTLRALERLKYYSENNKDISVKTKEIDGILTQGELLFTTKLRNCMMHYNLENAGVISFENIDKPFYGIIETCFDGMSYQEYLLALHNLSDRIIDFLSNQFDFTDVKLERL